MVEVELFLDLATGVVGRGPDPHQRGRIQKSDLRKKFLKMVEDELLSDRAVGVAGRGPDPHQ